MALFSSSRNLVKLLYYDQFGGRKRRLKCFSKFAKMVSCFTTAFGLKICRERPSRLLFSTNCPLLIVDDVAAVVGIKWQKNVDGCDSDWERKEDTETRREGNKLGTINWERERGREKNKCLYKKNKNWNRDELIEVERQNKKKKTEREINFIWERYLELDV